MPYSRKHMRCITTQITGMGNKLQWQVLSGRDFISCVSAIKPGFVSNLLHFLDGYSSSSGKTFFLSREFLITPSRWALQCHCISHYHCHWGRVIFNFWKGEAMICNLKCPALFQAFWLDTVRNEWQYVWHFVTSGMSCVLSHSVICNFIIDCHC